jgi:hypothetical protein
VDNSAPVMMDDTDETVFRVGAPLSTEVDWSGLVVWGRANVWGSTGIRSSCVVPKDAMWSGQWIIMIMALVTCERRWGC